MAINTTLKLLEDLKNTSKNWRLTANNYDKNEMKKLVKYASSITGEKVTKDYIKNNFKTFHSAIKYYTNIEKKLVENKETGDIRLRGRVSPALKSKLYVKSDNSLTEE